MKRKILNKIISAIAVIIIITLSVCKLADNKLSYSLIKKDGNYYISLRGSHDKGPRGCMEEIYVQFDSFDDMIKRITENELTQDELADIERGFTKAANGQIPIFDIYNMMTPTLPEGVNTDYIKWYDGMTYQLHFAGSEQMKGIVEYYGGNNEHYFNHSICVQNGGSHTEKTHIDDRNSDIYIFTSGYGEAKCVCYNISGQNGDEIIHVEEYYLLNSEEYSSWVSDTAPFYLQIWRTIESQKLYVAIYLLPERPSVEWLSSFGLQAYKDDSLDVK